MNLPEILDNARKIAESARMHADTYAANGRKGGVTPGTGFYRKGGVDAMYLSELTRKAEAAEKAVVDLEEMIKLLG